MVRRLCVLLNMFCFAELIANAVDTQPARVEIPVQAILAQMELLRVSALGTDRSQFESWQAISPDQIYQPSDLKLTGFSWLGVSDADPTRLRVQFADRRQVVEVVFPLRLLFDPALQTGLTKEFQPTHGAHSIVGQNGRILRPVLSPARENGCDVTLAAVRYLLSGHRNVSSGVFRSCEGRPVLATFLRIGTLPYAWVTEVPLAVEGQPRSQIGRYSTSLTVLPDFVPWATLVLLLSLGVLFGLDKRRRNSQAQSLAESVDRYSLALRQSQQSRGILSSMKNQIAESRIAEDILSEQSERPTPRFHHLRSANGADARAHALVHDFSVHASRNLQQRQRLSVGFFSYHAETREMDWKAAVGHWGVGANLRDTGFVLSAELLNEARSSHTAGEIYSLEGYPPLTQWWMEAWGATAKAAREGVLAWIIWPPTAGNPVGTLIVRSPALTPLQEQGFVLCLLEAANAWKTDGAGPAAHQQPEVQHD